MKYKVTVFEECDGFCIEVEEFHEHDIVSSRFFSFNQEDSKEGLVEVFEELGIKSEYELVY